MPMRLMRLCFVASLCLENWVLEEEHFALSPDVLGRNFGSSWNFEMGLVSLESGDKFLSTILLSGSR